PEILDASCVRPDRAPSGDAAVYVVFVQVPSGRYAPPPGDFVRDLAGQLTDFVACGSPAVHHTTARLCLAGVRLGDGTDLGAQGPGYRLRAGRAGRRRTRPGAADVPPRGGHPSAPPG